MIWNTYVMVSEAKNNGNKMIMLYYSTSHYAYVSISKTLCLILAHISLKPSSPTLGSVGVLGCRGRSQSIFLP